jgi:arsenate reductase (thioredoxin)
MAEHSLHRWGRGRFRAFSAGTRPTGRVHPMTLGLLQSLDFKTEGQRSKSWKELTTPGAPESGAVPS